MKIWFAKKGLSAALDSGKAPSRWLQRNVANSPELRDFEQDLMSLDRALREPAPKPAVPASLHGSIMQAVRAADRPPRSERQLPRLRWAPMPVFAAVVALLAWWVVNRPAPPTAPDPQSLAGAATALEMSSQLARAMPSAVISPLSVELDRLNQDLDNTAQFLLASLP